MMPETPHPARPPWVRAHRRAGYTMIEVIIGLAILAIMAGFAMPLLGNTIAQRRLLGATDRLATDLRKVQSMAVTQGRVHRLRSGDDPLAGQPGRYRLEQSTDGGATWTALTTWVNLGAEFTGATLASIRDSSPGPLTIFEVRFNAQGASATAGVTHPIRLTVTTATGSRTIDVMLTGFIRVP